MRPKLLLLCLALLGAGHSVPAQSGGVPLLGYYRACLVPANIQRPEIIRAEIIQPVIVRPEIERPVMVSAQIERPAIMAPQFDVPTMVRPTYLDACLDQNFAAALLRSSAVLGVKFDAAGRIAKREGSDDLVAAALLPPEVAAKVIVPPKAVVTKPSAAAAVPDEDCCGGAPVPKAPAVKPAAQNLR